MIYFVNLFKCYTYFFIYKKKSHRLSVSRNKCCQTMLIFQKMVFIFLLVSLQWSRCDSTSPTVPTSSFKNTATTSTYISELSTNIGTSTMTVVTSPTVTHHSEISTTRKPLSQTTQKMNYSTENTTQSFTSENRTSSSSEMSSPSEIPATTSKMSIISESYANTTYTEPSETASNSFTTTTYDGSFTTMVSTNDAQNASETAPPNNTTSAISSTTSNNAETVLSEQTTSVQSSSTNSSPETREPRKGKSALSVLHIIYLYFSVLQLSCSNYHTVTLDTQPWHILI